MQKHSVTIEAINGLFYREGDAILPLYEDLKTTRASEAQVRIALLQAFRAALETGEFQAETESIRQECQDRKCYANNNFGNNFNNNATLFDFEKYSKATDRMKLSVRGQTELAELIRELQ